jgi:hypothetical protein
MSEDLRFHSPWRLDADAVESFKNVSSVYLLDCHDFPVCEMVPFGDQWTVGEVQRVMALTATPELLKACKAALDFLDKLEDGTDKNDPLSQIRKRVHAPLREKLEPAIAKAEGRL